MLIDCVPYLAYYLPHLFQGVYLHSPFDFSGADFLRIKVDFGEILTMDNTAFFMIGYLIYSSLQVPGVLLILIYMVHYYCTAHVLHVYIYFQFLILTLQAQEIIPHTFSKQSLQHATFCFALRK